MALRNRRPLRFRSLRAELMIFLSGGILLILLLVGLLTSAALQPLYRSHIRSRLNGQLDVLVGLMDDAAADGTILSERWWTLRLNPVFWGENGPVEQALQSGRLSLANCCLDIADGTARHIAYAENLYPCLLHESRGSGFDHTATAQRDSTLAVRLRMQCFAQGKVDEVIETASGSRQLVIGRTTADGNYAVLISTSMARVEEAAAVLQRLLPFIGLGLFLLSLLAAWRFSLWFTLPISRLSAAVQQMAAGHYDARVAVTDAGDELNTLAKEFNAMAGAVERTARAQREMLANVSHDLRTPLTLIKGYAETVRDISGDDKARRDEQMNIIVDEVDRLSGLVNSVMELNRMSSGMQKCSVTRFDLAQLCEETAACYDALCARNGWQLILQLPQQPLPVQADPALLERALHNLLGNAMHHMGADGVFYLRAILTTDGVRVEVEDHGPGIAAEDLPYIFDRYYRSRSDAGQPGTGLGLSITQAIFQQHGFRFGVESTVGKGSTFWFLVPLCGAAPQAD